MVLVAIAWLYVVLLVAIVEATSPNGTLLGALVTVVLYGVLPLGIIGYLFFSPARRRAQRARSARLDPDAGGHAAGDTVAPERKEP
jgi:predicted membrane channel-forming protein YqfA (hemolysin III family)